MTCRTWMISFMLNNDGYSLLVTEFVAEGALTEPLIQAGPNAGKKNTKQDWSMFFILSLALCYV
jgi:hypothetical protein